MIKKVSIIFSIAILILLITWVSIFWHITSQLSTGIINHNINNMLRENHIGYRVEVEKYSPRFLKVDFINTSIKKIHKSEPFLEINELILSFWQSLFLRLNGTAAISENKFSFTYSLLEQEFLLMGSQINSNIVPYVKNNFPSLTTRWDTQTSFKVQENNLQVTASTGQIILKKEILKKILPFLNLEVNLSNITVDITVKNKLANFDIHIQGDFRGRIFGRIELEQDIAKSSYRASIQGTFSDSFQKETENFLHLIEQHIKNGKLHIQIEGDFLSFPQIIT